MRLVVDTNIVLSCLLKPNGLTSPLFFHTGISLELFGPERLMSELTLHRKKVMALTGLPQDRIAALEELLMSRVQIIPNAAIPSSTWERAFDLVKGVDEDDDQFVALALHLECSLWTSDKKLLAGLRKRGFQQVVNNEELRKALGG